MINKKGFTLVETIVALTIFSFVATLISLLYANGYASYVKNNQKIEVQENLRIALNKMSQEIRQAESVPSVTDNDLSVDTDKDGDPENDNDKISFEIGNDTISYYYNSNVILRNGSPITNESFITYLKFDYEKSSKTVTINIKGKKPITDENTDEISMRTKIQLRAL